MTDTTCTADERVEADIAFLREGALELPIETDPFLSVRFYVRGLTRLAARSNLSFNALQTIQAERNKAISMMQALRHGLASKRNSAAG